MGHEEHIKSSLGTKCAVFCAHLTYTVGSQPFLYWLVLATATANFVRVSLLPDVCIMCLKFTVSGSYARVKVVTGVGYMNSARGAN